LLRQELLFRLGKVLRYRIPVLPRLGLLRSHPTL
jgi:hypothetical protein